jgi:hypothetical protein
MKTRLVGRVLMLGPGSEPATFTSTVTIQRRPGGPFEFLWGQPTSLRVGEHLTVTVRQ